MSTDFLAHHQPTPTTVTALWYIHHFETQGTWQKDFAFEKRLRDCQLDYSLGSLKRIGELLEQIRRLKPNPDTFFKHANHQVFLFTVAFYCGEVRGRLAQIAPIWYTWQEFAAEHPDLKERYPHCLDYQFVCYLPNDDYFFPIQAILSALFDEPDQMQSVYQATLGNYQAVADEVVLPEMPPHGLDFDMNQALAQTPIEFLPYLQMLPPTTLYGDDLMGQIRHLHKLYQSGRVVWAALVHADQRLVDYGNAAASRAQIIYDPTGRTSPAQLDAYAEQFYQYQQDHPQSPSEDGALFTPVPSEISHMPLLSGSLWVWRPHLPNGMLTLPVFPILMADDVPAVTILPARYWTQTSWYVKWLQQQAELNEQQSKEPRSSQETTYAFEHLLRQQPDFWANYHELLSPQSEHLPDLGTQPRHHPVVPHESDQRFIQLCRANAMLTYPRAQEHRPSMRTIAECVKQIQSHQTTETFESDVQMYAQLRLLNWKNLLEEVAQPYAKSRPLPKVASIIQRDKLGAAHIAKLVDFLQEQRFVHQNTTAMLYLSYLYYSGKLVSQSILEGESCLKMACQLGDYRAIKWLAEILLIAPQRAAVLLAEDVARDSQALADCYQAAQTAGTFQYDADEFQAQIQAFLHDPFAQLEQIRRLFYRAAELGHPTASARVRELIAQERLPETASENRFTDINEWLMAHFDYQPDDFKLSFDHPESEHTQETQGLLSRLFHK